MASPTVLLASGSNARGQLASGTVEDSYNFIACNFLGYRPGELPSNTRQILHLASGSNHALALLERQIGEEDARTELWGCGDGSKGQLGPSYSREVEKNAENLDASRSVFRRLDLSPEEFGLEGYSCRLIASAWETSYVVFSCHGRGDVVVSMGVDDYGDLGIGESRKGKNAVKPVNFVKFDHITIHAHKLDIDRLCIESLSAGPHHVVLQARCGLVSSLNASAGAEYLTIGWGASRHGQLGLIHQTPRPSTFVSTPRLITEVATLAEDTIISLSLGNQHSVFVNASGHVSCMGSDKKAQLRDLTTLKDVKYAVCTWNGTYAVVDSDHGENGIFATGSYAKGQLGRQIPKVDLSSTSLPLDSVQFPFKYSSRKLVNLTCGSEHVLTLFRTIGDRRENTESAIGNATEVWGWGWNEHGNLGTGTTEDVYLPAKIWPSTLDDDKTLGIAVGIWGGCGTSWIALNQLR